MSSEVSANETPVEEIVQQPIIETPVEQTQVTTEEQTPVVDNTTPTILVDSITSSKEIFVGAVTIVALTDVYPKFAWKKINEEGLYQRLLKSTIPENVIVTINDEDKPEEDFIQKNDCVLCFA